MEWRKRETWETTTMMALDSSITMTIMIGRIVLSSRKAATTRTYQNQSLHVLNGGKVSDAISFISFSNTSMIYYTLHLDNRDDGPMVVYSLYKDGHNDCKRHKIGTYQVPVSYFLKAHGAQLYKESYYTGVEYKGRDMQDYLNCQATKINDAYVSLLILFSSYPSNANSP